MLAIVAAPAIGVPEATQTAAEEIPLSNPGFEHGGRRNRVASWERIAGWDSVAAGDSGVLRNASAAPVDGAWVAFQEGSGEWITQVTEHRLVAGATYTLRLWARSINRIGNTAETVVEAGLAAGGTELAVRQEAVNPARLQGAPLHEPNDDGGNVWIDGDRRHQFADIHLYQELDADPLRDPWHASLSDYAAYDRFGAWAVGPILFPGGKWVYGVHYDEHAPDVSEIRFMKADGAGDPAYRWSWPPTTVLFHVGDEDPWVIDPHVTWDETTGRLWLAWGGGTLWVSELDPVTGMLLADPEDKEFDSHPEYHTPVALWEGDAWSTGWVEGPALYRHGDYWYLFGRYGNLSHNYTIRVGRGRSPTGPFYDKRGVALTERDPFTGSYGNTIILGTEGGHSNPGHPHVWEEDGSFYLGYDYRDAYDLSFVDRFAIRRLYWVDDWPVVAYTPGEVAVQVPSGHPAAGESVAVFFRNAGAPASVLAVDYVTLTLQH